MILREVRSRIVGTLVWALAFFSMIVWGMTEFDAFGTTSGDGLAQLMDSFPRVVRAIYGMDGVDVSTVEGYFSLLLLYTLVMVAVHGSLLGAGLINRELKSGAYEFLFSTPLSRFDVVFRKEIAALIIMVILQVVIGVSTWMALDGTGSEKLLVHTLLATVVTHVVFFHVGYAAALFFVNRRRSQAVAVFAPLLGYLLVVVSQLFGVPLLADITPLGFYDASYLLESVGEAIPYSIGAVVLSIIIKAGTMLVFRKRDLTGD